MAKDKVLVPSPNWSNSNTPTGPFQIIVLASFKYSAKALAVSGPISKIISSASTSSTLLRVATAVSENSLPQTTSVGNGIDTFSISFLAAGIKSGSYSDLPTGLPAAAKKVLAIPPPTIIWSQISDNDSNTSSLVETLAPPTIATNGRPGFPTLCLTLLIHWLVMGRRMRQEQTWRRHGLKLGRGGRYQKRP